MLPMFGEKLRKKQSHLTCHFSQEAFLDFFHPQPKSVLGVPTPVGQEGVKIGMEFRTESKQN